MWQVIFDRVKIKRGNGFAKGLKLRGPKVLFPKYGGQNCYFWKLGGPKVHFILNFMVKYVFDSYKYINFFYFSRSKNFHHF